MPKKTASRSVLRPLALVVALVIGACSVQGSIGSEAGGAGGGNAVASTVSTGTGSVTAQSFDKVDVLLGVDNSPGMAEKQAILQAAIGDLTAALANPPCLDSLTGVAVPSQPAGPLDACPAGSKRQFAPILDIHIGVVTTSLGGHGSGSCPSIDTTSCPGGAINGSKDDHGHLVTRVGPCSNASVPTYQDQGFLAWDPAQMDNPPGTTALSDLTSSAGALEIGAGELGCVYASQLESWYRFLVDPDPYQSIGVSGGLIVTTGTDATLLAERQDFLRPDSLLAILMLSDEDDCSVQESGQAYLVLQTTGHLPPARSECAKDPSDPCCLSCAGPQGSCPVDPNCANPTLDPASDSYSLRCWDEKRRFGVDYLYPVSRYVTGLTAPMVVNRAGEMVTNPVFSNVDPKGPVRDPTMVLLGGIVGVPWQDIARDATDLTQGFKNAEELAQASAGVTAWDVILGDPDKGTLPLDPHMIASTSPRMGTDPVTGTSLAAPGSPPGADPISGHELSQATPVELEYACIFPLLVPRDCTVPGAVACACTDPQNDSPLCEPDQTKNDQPTLQAWDKATPSLRQLQVLKALGSQAAVASICAAQRSNQGRLDFGYRPAIRALVERVSRRAGGQ